MRIFLLLGLLGAVSIAEHPKSAFEILDGLKKPSVPAFVGALQPTVKEGFTLAFKSISEQGPERGLLFGSNAETIFAVPARGNSIELVRDQDGVLIPETISFSPAGSKPAYHRDGKPTSCAQCHGNPFTYIWRQYKGDRVGSTWPEFIGDSDDRVNPTDPAFTQLKARENFAPLFADKKARASFPYWQIRVTSEDGKPQDESVIPAPIDPSKEYPGYKVSDEERLFTRSPNARLTALITSRAARSVGRRASTTHPERYARYKYALLRVLLNCVGAYGFDSNTEEWNLLRKDFKRDNPGVFAEWEAYEKNRTVLKGLRSNGGMDPKVKDIYPLVLLNYLGVAPESILLQEPLKDPSRRATATLESLDHLLKEGSPLDYNPAVHADLRDGIAIHLSDLNLTELGVESEPDPAFPDFKLMAELDLENSEKGCAALKEKSLAQITAPAEPAEKHNSTPRPKNDPTHK